MLLPFLLAIFLAPVIVVGKQTSINVSYTDSRITYSGTWEDVQDDFGCKRKATQAARSSASLSFRGVAIQILGDYALVIYNDITVVLDGNSSSIISGIDEPRCDELLFESTGLSDQEHTITITKAGDTLGELDLDKFVYTGASHSAGTGPSAPVTVGSVVGAVTGAAGVAGLTAFAVHHYMNKPPVPGAYAAKSHTFVFVPPPPAPLGSGRKLGQVQITLTLSHKEVNIPSYGHQDVVGRQFVAWKVFTLGGDSKNEVEVDLPYDLAFGNARVVGREEGHRNNILLTEVFQFAPLRSLLTMTSGVESLLWGKPSKRARRTPPHVAAKNDTGVPKKFALGSFHYPKHKNRAPDFRPFLLIGDIRNGGIYSASPDLILHAFRTENCREGQILVMDDRLLREGLFDEGGVEVASLQKTTKWHLTSVSNRGLKLVIRGAKSGAKKPSESKPGRNKAIVATSAKSG